MTDKQIEEAKRAAATSPPIKFVHDWLLSTSPFAFRSSDTLFTAFRSELGTALGVHAADIALVGSGQLGFSLNPKKLLSPFGPGSDLLFAEDGAEEGFGIVAR